MATPPTGAQGQGDVAGEASAKPLTAESVVAQAKASSTNLLSDDVVAWCVRLPDLDLLRLRGELRTAGAKEPPGWHKLLVARRKALATEAARTTTRTKPQPNDDGGEDEKTDDPRPVIRPVVGDPDAYVRASVTSLAQDPNLFVRDCDLVHVTRALTTNETGDDPNDVVPAGTPRVHTTTLATLRVRMCTWARWEREKTTRGVSYWVQCEPTRAMAEEVRDGGEFQGLRPLSGVAETPFPRPDGTIVQTRGYDPVTNYLYEPNGTFLPVTDPTPEDAQTVGRAAYAALADLFADFPFAAEAGRAAAVAAVLTLVGRPAVQGPVPAWVFDATTPGTGKTLIADVCAAVAYGRDAGRHHFPFVTGRDADAELSKALATLARRGASLVNFDNCDNATIGGDVLEDVISCRSDYTFRILGKTEGLTLPWRTVVFATANNADWSRGMNRRILHVRLESPFEQPEHRPLDSYVHPERAGRMFEFVLKHRAEYVHHALTLLRAYFVAGKPEPLTLGTFETWAALVAGAIVWAGGANPLECRPSQSGEESQDVEYGREFVREWDKFVKGKNEAASVRDVIQVCWPPEQKGQVNPTDGYEPFREAILYFIPTRAGTTPSSIAVAELIRGRFKGAPTINENAPAPLKRFVMDKTKNGRQCWKIEDVHTNAKARPINIDTSQQSPATNAQPTTTPTQEPASNASGTQVDASNPNAAMYEALRLEALRNGEQPLDPLGERQDE